jgi:BRO1-like domain
MHTGLLKYLRENVTLKTDSPRSVDISGECCTMLESLMLAQAQEMFYELMHAKRTANPKAFTYGLLAQVAASTAGLYNEVAEKYAKPQLVKHFDKEWAESSRVKNILYTAEAHYMQALQLQPQAGAKFGEYLGHLRLAASLLQGKHKDARQAPGALQQQFKARHCQPCASYAPHRDKSTLCRLQQCAQVCAQAMLSHCGTVPQRVPAHAQGHGAVKGFTGSGKRGPPSGGFRRRARPAVQDAVRMSAALIRNVPCMCIMRAQHAVHAQRAMRVGDGGQAVSAAGGGRA